MPVARSNGSTDCAEGAAEPQQEPVSSAELSQQQQPVCRVCWAEDDDDDGGSLIAPCRCIGTQKWVHERCLREWQQTQIQQALHHRAKMCEVCKSQYRAPEYLNPIPASERRRRRLQALIRLVVARMSDLRWWGRLAVKAWRAYVFMSGVMQAGCMGYKGLVIGMQLGQALIKDQASIMVQLLARLAKVLGSPYAELLWTQAAAAMALGLATEFLYTTVIGLVTGTAYGFVRGYTEALNLSALLLRQGCAKGARLVFKLLSRAGAALSSSAMKLPAALPGGCRFICRGICRGGRIT